VAGVRPGPEAPPNRHTSDPLGLPESFALRSDPGASPIPADHRAREIPEVRAGRYDRSRLHAQRTAVLETAGIIAYDQTIARTSHYRGDREQGLTVRMSFVAGASASCSA